MRFAIIVILLVTSVLSAQNDEGFIYGKVTLRNGDEYLGPIRWGNEYGKEVYWLDTFDASKTRNEYEDYVTEEMRDEIRKSIRKRGIVSFFERLFDDDYRREGISTHQFVCHFGDIKRIQIDGKRRAIVTLKNNAEIEVEGSGDIGQNIYVIDENGRTQKLRWKSVDVVDFMPTPKTLKHRFGTPLYGRVETNYKTFEGLVQWDYEECFGEDILNGDEAEFYFDEIGAIEKYRSNRSRVTLKNGEETILSGTNDVDSDNRGIVIKDLVYGKIDVSWKEFVKLVIKENNPYSGPAYDEFKPAKEINGTVKLETSRSLSGRIAYDIDETYDIEFLEGEVDHIKFSIPFRSIESITPSGRGSATLQLINGEEIRLSDQRDVSRDNDGLLVWSGKTDPEYIPWRDIESIKLK